MISYKIEVLPIDLKGHRNSSGSCPIVLATKRVFPNEKISVGNRIMTIGQKQIYMPNLAQDFVAKWDSMEEVDKLPTFYVNL